MSQPTTSAFTLYNPPPLTLSITHTHTSSHPNLMSFTVVSTNERTTVRYGTLDLIIVPLNLEAAFAQEFVLRRAKANGYEDAFLNYIPMESPGEAVILSDTYVYWRRPKALWVSEVSKVPYQVMLRISYPIIR